MPLELAFDQAFVMVNMLGLFGQFFYKSYIKSKDDGEGDKVKSKGKGKENKIKETKKSK